MSYILTEKGGDFLNAAADYIDEISRETAKENDNGNGIRNKKGRGAAKIEKAGEPEPGPESAPEEVPEEGTEGAEETEETACADLNKILEEKTAQIDEIINE
jgi:hypothetical protein